MNRRKFLMTTAGIAFVGMRGASAAAGYDLVLKRGHVVDPASGLNAVRDVAIADGKIAAVAATIDAGAALALEADLNLPLVALLSDRRHGASLCT